MSNAYQCDACREFFTLDEVPHIKPSDFKSCFDEPDRPKFQPILLTLSSKFKDVGSMSIHICPKCLDEILGEYFSRELPPEEAEPPVEEVEKCQ